MRGYKLGEASLRLPELAGDKLEIDTRVRWFDATQVPFYGVGGNSRKEARVNYGLEQFEAGRDGRAQARAVVSDRRGSHGASSRIGRAPVPAHRLRCCRRRHRCCFRKRDTCNRTWCRHRLARVAQATPARRPARSPGTTSRTPTTSSRSSASTPRFNKPHHYSKTLGDRVPRSGARPRSRMADHSLLPVANARWRAFIAATRTSGSRTGTSCY